MSKPGAVSGIYLAPAAGNPPAFVTSARAVAARGLEGDRYFTGRGSFSRWAGEGRAVSLVEHEAIDAVFAAGGPEVKSGQHRRNIVTACVDLRSLVGRQFRVGCAILRGTRECTVCGYLNRASGLKVAEALRGRGGLRADVVADGDIRVGDSISVI